MSIQKANNAALSRAADMPRGSGWSVVQLDPQDFVANEIV